MFTTFSLPHGILGLGCSPKKFYPISVVSSFGVVNTSMFGTPSSPITIIATITKSMGECF